MDERFGRSRLARLPTKLIQLSLIYGLRRESFFATTSMKSGRNNYLRDGRAMLERVFLQYAKGFYPEKTNIKLNPRPCVKDYGVT